MIEQIDSGVAEFVPILINKPGGYYNTSGVWVDNANIKSVGPIPLLPKQILHISTNSAGVVRTLFECGEDESYITGIRVGNNNNVTDSILNDTDEIKYYFASSGNSFDMKIRVSNKFLLYGESVAYSDKLDILSRCLRTNDEVGQVTLNYTDILNTADYAMTTPFFISKGTKVSLAAWVSTDYYAIIKTDKFGHALTGLVAGTGGEHQFYQYTATEDCWVCVQGYVVNKIKLYYAKNWNDDYFLDDRRRAVISFSFDDMHDDDDQFYDLFAAHGFACGFSLIGNLSIDTKDTERYLKWQDEGFSVLAHSVDGDTMRNGDLTVSEAAEKMQLSKQRLYSRGYKADGWVTPSSNLGSDFFGPLEDFYEYGYTSYYGTYPSADNNDRPPYTTFATSPYELYMVHLDSTLANLEAALDACIANTGWMNCYLHAFEITPEKMEKLDDFLDYIETKIADGTLKCLAPNKAYEYFYNVRKSDLS